ncbi:cupin domain-containing protein [Aquincola sp. MAHUQ-54]|uniref:Cupin domain-containing protein n=1 Tax=Aquincola agrisoli TaxID=3119538 RepID=A0AAW9QAV4_9BURK
MALPHAAAGEIVPAAPLGAALAEARSHTLVQADGLQIFRLVLRAGQSLAMHQVPGRLVIQCLDGAFEFETMGRRLPMQPGDLCHIAPHAPHAVHAQQPASALVFLFGPATHHPHPTEDTP